MMDAAVLRRHLDRRLAALRTERSEWEAHWRELADYIAPDRFREHTHQRNQGIKLRSKIIDTTAGQAAHILASGIRSGMSSPSRPWFRLVPQDRSLLDQPGARGWVHVVEERLRAILSAGTFYHAMFEAYYDLAIFGTAVVVVTDDLEDILRFHALPVGSYWLAAGPTGTVDTLYRQSRMTVGQVVETFGYDAASDRVQSAWADKRYDTEVEVLHAVEPRRDRKPDSGDARNKRWRSVYWEVGSHGVLRDGGMGRFRVLAPRWRVVGNDVYGRSPGMQALADVKSLQVLAAGLMEAIEYSRKPPLVGPSALRSQHTNIVPGGISWVQNLAESTLRPIYEVNPRVNEQMVLIQDLRQQVRTAFHNDLFLAITQMEGVQPRNDLEMMERRAEKVMGIGPVLERAKDELLNPAIEMVFTAAMELELLPPPPSELDGVPLEVEMQSVLARDQRMDAILAMERTVGFIGNLAAAYPNAAAKLDAVEAINTYARLTGAPPPVLRSDQDAQAQAHAAGQAQQADRVLAQVRAGAESAKLLAETPIEDNSALGQLLPR